jgi:hypothetical protein
MSPPWVVVLYEDQRGMRPGFGPHELLVRLVADRLPRSDLWRLARGIREHPTRGNAKLLEKVRDPDRVAPGGEVVVAVLDDDHVRTLLSLDQSACKSVVLGAIRKPCSSPGRLRIVLLERNVESILEALRPHAGAMGLPPDSFDRAVRRKDINARDRVLREASRQEHRLVRDALLVAMPSLRRLRDAVFEAVVHAGAY